MKPHHQEGTAIDIRQQIKERLSDLGWTTAELCRRACVDYSHTHKWLNGKKEGASSVTLDLILDALGWNGIAWNDPWM